MSNTRNVFIQILAIVAMWFVLPGSILAQVPDSDLEQGFKSPPNSAKPPHRSPIS